MMAAAPAESNGESHLHKLAAVLHYCADPTAFRRNGYLHGVPKSMKAFTVLVPFTSDPYLSNYEGCTCCENQCQPGFE